MTPSAPTEPFVPVGFRYGSVYQLSAKGYPNATAVAVGGKIPPYDGIELVAPRTFNLTIPNPRTVPQLGNDRIVAIDLLPPQQPYVGEVHASALNFDLDALVQNTKKTQIGVMQLMPRLTDQQGFEPIVGTMFYQQGLLKSSRTRIWHAYVMPATRLVYLAPGFLDTPEDVKYYMTPNPSIIYLWGQPLVLATDGASEAGIADMYSTFKPHITSWLSDGTSTEMDFSPNFNAVDVARVALFVDGVLTSAGVTVSVDKIIWSAVPTAGKMVVAVYEVA